MKKVFLLCAIPILIGFAGVASADTINVAASSNGGFISNWSGNFSGVPLNTLIDGVFRPQYTGWTDGTVWWQTNEEYWIEISFDQQYSIEGLIIQADDNDSYTLLEYWSDPISSWVVGWNVPNYDWYQGVNLWGMQTRPNPYDNTEQYLLETPFVTNKIRVKAAAGDDSYSLSEVQAYGTPIPEPTTILLLVTGLLGLAGTRRRFKK